MDLPTTHRPWLAVATLLALLTSCSSDSRSTMEASSTAGSGTSASGSGGTVTAGASGSIAPAQPRPTPPPPSAGNNSQSSGSAGANVTATAGAAAVGGRAGSAGAPATPPPPASPNVAGTGAAGAPATPPQTKFSFFVTSIEAIREWSKNENGFGGNLSYGQSSGLAGADKICTEIADKALPGSGAKTWRAFLSASKGGGNGGPVHAKDRIGTGPWYDRTGRVIAMDLTALLQTRPMGGDPTIVNNLPNERGEPNQADRGIDNHDMLTGTNAKGEYDQTSTCEDWTSTTTPSGQMGPRIGHAWPAGSGMGWMSAHMVPSCAPSVSLRQGGGGPTGVGSLGGYGGFYCFALTP